MRKLKKVVALTLAATMVLGSSLTTFAEGETSGESIGQGSSEGHVDKKKTNVVLPTIIESNPSSFNYTMDPEGLVSATDHTKYENAEFPEADNDTGVYFNNGKKGGDGADKDNIVYKNTSSELTATNKSSHGINLTVKAEAVSQTNDIPLVTKEAITSATDASLYLGLIVNSDAAVAVTKDAAASKTVVVDGNNDNFKVATKDDGGYEYRELTLVEYQALDGNSSKTQDDYDATWKKATFKLEGSTTKDKAITSTMTAPNVKVTWSWVDPSANAAPSISTTTYNSVNLGSAEGGDVAIQVNLGTGTLAATGIANVKRGNDALAASMYSFDSTTKVLTLSRANVLQYWNMDTVTLTVTFAGETASTPTTVDITLNKGAAGTGD